MSHETDLYEVNDREPSEPEPCDWYPANEPVDLDKLRTDYEASLSESRITGAHLSAVFDAVIPMARELEEARRRIAAFEALPTREEWAVTENESTPPNPETVGPFTADGAMRAAAKHGVQAWLRIRTADSVVIRDWEPIANERPF